jgi:hypothetical protein
VLALAAVVATLLRFPARACVVLACVAAMLCATTSASALERVQTKTRVWDFSFAEPLNIRPNALASVEQRPGFSPAEAEPALGSPHAARGGVRVASGMGTGSAPASIVRTIARGEKVADIVAEGKALTFATGNEHALVSLTTGERVIVSGGPTGIDLSGLSVRRIIGHTHPYHLAPTGPSAADFGALQQLGQRSSYLLEHGDLSRFWLGGP